MGADFGCFDGMHVVRDCRLVQAFLQRERARPGQVPREKEKGAWDRLGSPVHHRQYTLNSVVEIEYVERSNKIIITVTVLLLILSLHQLRKQISDTIQAPLFHVLFSWPSWTRGGLLSFATLAWASSLE